MARMIPELTQEQLRELPSRAEARFYEACRRQLPANVLVIYSTTWLYRDARGQLREGEGDFAIVDPRSGVFAIELKGGGVSVDGSKGRWASIDRHGTRHEIKDPFRQASKERYALRDQLTRHFLWRRWRGTHLLLGHAVMFPDIHDATPLVGPDRARQLMGIDDNMRDLVAWFAQVVAFWHSSDADPLGIEGVRLVEDILCRSVEVRPALRSLLDEAEQTRLQLTANQAKVLRILGGRKRAVISGGAGTGKTLIAVEKARQLAESLPSVLLLCYNRPLADVLAATVREQPRITVLSFHQLCERRIAACRATAGKDVLKEAQEAYPGTSDKHLFDVQMPYALALSNEVLEDKFDALVVPDTFLARLELTSRVEHAPAILFGARRLLLQMCGWLSARRSGTTAYTLRWCHDVMRSKTAGDGGELTIRTAEPTRDVEHLCRLLAEHLAKVELLAPVGDLALEAVGVRALEEVSASLIPDPVRHGEALNLVLERVAARLGTSRVARSLSSTRCGCSPALTR